MMNAEIIAVGSELLTPSKLDTNSLYLTGRLNDLGVEVVAKMVVGDQRARLEEAVRAAHARTEIVILTGGLGPTEDDVTREAVSAALNVPLELDANVLRSIEERFARLRRTMAEINKRQAFVLRGASVLPNPHGTAPGLWWENEGKVVLLLPGPPRELKPMFEDYCFPRLQALAPPLVIRTRFFRVAGMGESDVDQLIGPVYRQYDNPVTTILAAPGDVQIHLRARCPDPQQAEALLDELAARILPLLGNRVYSRTGESLEEVVGRLLHARGETLAVAESCTAGGIAARITAVPGSSRYFLGGFLAYTPAMKTRLLGVREETLSQFPVVSQEVAREMADGARLRTGAHWALAITGVAGPGPDDQGTPAGLIWTSVATPSQTVTQKAELFGDRERVRTVAAQSALDLLRRLLESEQAPPHIAIAPA